MKTYRVGVVGCRARGTTIARAYHAHPRTELVGLCDLEPERRDSLGDDLGVGARFDDLDAMIGATAPDMVVLAVGTGLHYELATRAIEHGMHVDVEKPMCVDLEQADALVARAAERGVRVAVHHQRRVSGHTRATAALLADGRLGELKYLSGSGKGYYGGYGLMNIGCHMINNMLEFAGHCRCVSAVATVGDRPITPDDVLTAPGGMGVVAGEHITATLHFDGNVTALLCQHRFGQVDVSRRWMDLYGWAGRVTWQVNGAWFLEHPSPGPDAPPAGWTPLDPHWPEPGAPEGVRPDEYAYVDEYVRALDEGRDHVCSGAEALHVIEVMMAIFESAAYGRRVDLPQAGRDHPLVRWRREHGLPDAGPKPYGYPEWVREEDKRLGRAEPAP